MKIKGISLPIDQYNALLASAPLIETILRKMKQEVVRPNYDGVEAAPITDDTQEEQREDNGGEDEEAHDEDEE